MVSNTSINRYWCSAYKLVQTRNYVQATAITYKVQVMYISAWCLPQLGRWGEAWSCDDQHVGSRIIQLQNYDWHDSLDQWKVCLWTSSFKSANCCLCEALLLFILKIKARVAAWIKDEMIYLRLTCFPVHKIPPCLWNNDETHENEDVPVVFFIPVLKQSLWNIYSLCRATASEIHYNQNMLLLILYKIYRDCRDI